MSIQDVNVARFARKVEWDFFCDFHTPCMYALEVLRPFLASHVDIRIKSSSRKYDLRSTQHESCQYEYNRWWCIYAHTIRIIYFWSKNHFFVVTLLGTIRKLYQSHSKSYPIAPIKYSIWLWANEKIGTFLLNCNKQGDWYKCNRSNWCNSTL